MIITSKKIIQMTFRVDIIVPVFNESENFKSLYNNLKQYVKSDWRLLVVYDFDKDTTVAPAIAISMTDPRVVLVKNESRGVLQALSTGFRCATTEAVLELMADDPVEIVQKIDEMVDIFYKQHATVVVASRYMKGGGHNGGPYLKGFLSRMAGLSLYWVVGLPTHDATYNTRLYRKSFLDSLSFESKKGFEIALEITLKAYFNGEKIVEVPVIWTEREIGTSKFKLLSWLPGYIRWYFYAIYNHFNPFSRKKSLKA